MKIEQANKLELHYFLVNNSHLVNAFVRNKCELELLTISKDICLALGYEIEVVSDIPSEGGFREFWKVLGKNSGQLNLIVTVLAILISRIPVSNKELEKLQIENLQLDNEEKRINLEKIKKTIGDSNKANADFIEDTVTFFDSNYKVIKHKSNFYQALQNYSSVTEISTATYFDDRLVTKPNHVKRKDFHKFILTSNDLPNVNIENAIIEVISPVLKGQYKWKGVYEGNIVDFTMKDNEYKKQVDKKQVSFQSGYFIECVLVIKRKIDDFGMIQNTGYIITTVLGKIEDKKIIETEQGKRYKKIQSDLKNQQELF